MKLLDKLFDKIEQRIINDLTAREDLSEEQLEEAIDKTIDKVAKSKKVANFVGTTMVDACVMVLILIPFDALLTLVCRNKYLDGYKNGKEAASNE